MRMPHSADRLSDLGDFGPNPGALRCRFHVPAALDPGAALVVVLHGCTQNAARYDHGSGWSALADRHGFALLYPEQTRANNPNLCFNWFVDGDVRRGEGEVASIRAMIAAIVAAHGIDPARIFVTGLSAGGAMASAMLAAYPEVFAAGAIIAGLPYGCASNVQQALQRMGGGGPVDAATLGAKVRNASPHRGPWPRVSIWQGSADHTVAPSNAEAIVLQWADVHGLSATPDRTEKVDGYPHRLWLGPDGAPLIEHYSITGMAHGTPLMPGTGEGQSGKAGPHMLDAGISSTDRIADFFAIAAPATARRAAAVEAAVIELPAPPRRGARQPAAAPASGVQAVIEDALRAAGLMR